MKSIEFTINKLQKLEPGLGASLADFSGQTAETVLAYHKGFDEYAPTPLSSLPGLAKTLGVEKIWLKDESKRFGLNAFKVLGGSYAMGRLMAEKLGLDLEKVGWAGVSSLEARKKAGQVVFVTATDGNHGRGVAWTAMKLGQRAVVFMPKGSAEIRAKNIRAAGAECSITELNYDEAVRLADKYAAEHGGTMVQDTAWPGYEDIPRWIMQGYMTLAQECLGQLGDEIPTHLFLQAGVGSFAGAVLGRFKSALGDKCPTTVIVEPHQANCLYQSLLAADGEPRQVGGEMRTIMAGLACGEPSVLSWPVIRDYASAAVSCDDFVAANGMRLLASPQGGDEPIVSGESGAVTAGLLEYVLSSSNGQELASRIGLNEKSRVLLISTEGDTSPDMYREIVWHGHKNQPLAENPDFRP
ncbi:MAG: diaminopropionate ammonia-lyase [Deltaproteobacteria bacterium]|jgi:diaminopropionate ammonia-lyase|nr:diaminopropionate ammonia-lyase [Deltaproteobacteria bacterium]